MKHDDEKPALFYESFSERAVLNPIVWINRVERTHACMHAGDCVAGEAWDSRREAGDRERVERGRRKLLDYALDVLCLLHKELTE